ncbi:TonB-dependent receptor plug domain-containing protein [Luteibaculum oceani]|uniref:TonB-dependent receptor n=1 Tax=Luteibaculum oceani TaxID=1294296 RepID=A0A5C6UY79_9FLAO|nr:TonB-dependent receptor plug domain-containing protein [Luteibaculum oceani]TXC75595.1 TonB-dependent receptor [Luteibaculum oceani]
MRWIINLVFLFCSLYTGAQNRTVNLDSVRVEGEKKGVESFAIEDSKIAISKGAAIPQLLTNHSSVYIKNFGPGTLSTINLRGASSSQTKVFWNGVEMNNPLSGQVDLSLIPVFMIDQLSISNNGDLDGSFGGDLNLTLNKRFRASRGIVSVGWGSFGQRNAMLGLNHRFKQTRVLFRTYLRKSDNDFTYTNTGVQGKPRERMTNAGFQQKGFYFGLLRSLNHQQIEFDLWQQQYERSLPTIMSYQGLGRDEFQSDFDTRFNLRHRFYFSRFKNEISLNVSILENNYRLSNKLNNTEWVPFVNSLSKGRSINFSNQLSWQGKGFSTFIQPNLKWENGNYIQFLNRSQNEVQRTIAGVKGGLVVEVNKTASLTLRSNLRWVDFDESWISGSLDFTKAFSGLDWNLAISRNVRIPTLNDINWYPGGNIKLLPEEAQGVQSKLSNSGSKWAWSGLLYFRNVKNWIQWKPSEFGYWRPENLARVLSFGAETELKFKATFTPSFTYQPTVNIGLNRSFEVEGTNRSQLMYMPVWVVNHWQKFIVNNIEFALGLNLVSERNTQTQGRVGISSKLPTYSLLNAELSKKLNIKKQNLSVGITLNNLLNQSYQNVLWRPMPGFNFLVNLNLTF